LLKTLHAYLLKDLVKVTLLTLVALTLLMSVLVIVQPLRKFGLAGTQLLEVFVYTVPAMLSLTLPFATLFAATLVYGRFSQDNELLAAKASGISTLSLLRPALGFGVVVTAASLVLINVVAPKLTTLSALAQTNMRKVFFHQLSSRGYAEFNREKDRHVIYADSTDLDANTLYGIIYVVQSKSSSPSKKPKDPNAAPASAASTQPAGGDAQKKQPSTTMIWAKWATLEFSRDPNGDDEVLIRAEFKVLAGSLPNQPIGGSKYAELPFPLPNPIKEKTSWYGWNDLLEFLKDPEKHVTVRREMAKIRQSLCSDMLGADVAAAIQAGKAYDGLTQGGERFIIEAAWAVPGKGGAVLSSKKPDGSEGKLVTVLVKKGNKAVESITARQGRVTLAWSRVTNTPQVSILLSEDVTVDNLTGLGRQQNRTTEWTRGQLPVPEGVVAKAEAINLTDIYKEPEKITSDKKVIASINNLRNKRIPQLRSDLMAELHVRSAYGASCFLMVAMGAALGLMFRGGQFISAFALSAVAAALPLLTLIMGKELIRNPANSDLLGMACIWGGIMMLAVADVVIYARLSRK